MTWHKARVSKVEAAQSRSLKLNLEFELLSGEHSGNTAKDLVAVNSVFTSCHKDKLWAALGGAPREGDVLEVFLDKKMNVVFKGYRRAT